MPGFDIKIRDLQMTAPGRPRTRTACYSHPAVRCLEENTLFGYVRGALDVAGRDAVRVHAASCDACRTMIAAAARSMPTEPARATEGTTGWSWPSLEADRLGPTKAPAPPGCAARTIAGKYALLRMLGSGGMGVVHEAVNTWTGRRVAIKELHGNDSDERLAVQRFKLEAKAASRIVHPNVVEILDLGQDPDTGSLFMVQELLTGSTLRQRIVERGSLTDDEVIRIIAPALSALVAAHDAGVVHRDLKPDNIFLAGDGVGGEVTKLIDFGLSKQHSPQPVLDVTGHGRQLGTPFYMSPEQLRAEADLDERTDVWAMGVVVFEMVAGVRPFVGPTYNELVVQILSDPVPQLIDVVPTVSPAINALVAQALERDRASRIRSRDLRDAFEELVQRPDVYSAPQGNPYRGLAHFEAAHRGVFFGRTAEVSAVVSQLRGSSFVLVAGDSGVGKSSLVRAGVLPMIAQSLARIDPGSSGPNATSARGMIAIATPGAQPLRAIAGSLAKVLDDDAESLAAQLIDDAAAVGARLQSRIADTEVADARQLRMVLFVDQLEELITLADGGEAALTSLALSSLLEAAGGLRLVATVRSDFLAKLAALPGLGDGVTEALYLCKPLSHYSLREVIVGPARLVGLRFESATLIDKLVASVGSSGCELPLLQFALAQLWETRDAQRNMISAAGLDAMGGVAGALAVHADSVLALIPPRHAALARHLLTSLVTEDGTRARKTARELASGARESSFEAVPVVLETLVQGRLVSVEVSDEEPRYQIAHDILVHEWDTLRGWRGRDIERSATRERLQRAAAEWERLGRPSSALWNRAQLAEVAELTQIALGFSTRPAAPTSAGSISVDAEFLVQSRRAARRRRFAGYAAVVGLPALVMLGFISAQIVAHRRTAQAIARHLYAADIALATAVVTAHEVNGLRATAFAAFDRQQPEAAELVWAKAIERQTALDATYRTAGQRFEAALALDGSNRVVRRRFAALLADRARLAEREYRALERDEFVQRMATYDDDGDQQVRWHAPGRLRIASTPSKAAVVVQHVLPHGLSAPSALGTTPVDGAALRPGSYLLTLRVPGRPDVRAPVVLGRSETLHLAIPIPAIVSNGYAYVPPGRFLYGSSDNEQIRRTLMNAQPLHPVSTEGYVIARHEVTFADWIAFLRSLPPAQREARLPRASEAAETRAGALLELIEVTPGQYRLALQPNSRRYEAGPDAPIDYASRATGSRQHWQRMPVSGISWDDALAYAAWLHSSGAVPGARPCNDHEWERAARGADARLFPNSDDLRPADANVAETYGRQPDAFGPDEVGTHRGSDSPFGVSDLAGNAWEWVASVSGDERVAIRGGSWYHNQVAARSNNREPAEPSLRAIAVGLRICSSIVEPMR